MYVTSQKFVLDDIMHQMLIDQTLILLACIHKAFFTDPVDTARDSCRFFIDIIHGFIGEYLLFPSGISQMGNDISFRFRPVQVRQDTVDINTQIMEMSAGEYAGFLRQAEVRIIAF